MTTTDELLLTDEFLDCYFGKSNIREQSKEDHELHYAKQPYFRQAEYDRDKQLIATYSNAAKPQDRFMLIVAAKLERSPGIKP